MIFSLHEFDLPFLVTAKGSTVLWALGCGDTDGSAATFENSSLSWNSHSAPILSLLLSSPLRTLPGGLDGGAGLIRYPPSSCTNVPLCAFFPFFLFFPTIFVGFFEVAAKKGWLRLSETMKFLNVPGLTALEVEAKKALFSPPLSFFTYCSFALPPLFFVFTVGES